MSQSEITLTVMFADIVDSSRLYSERGDEAAQTIILGGVDLLKDVVAQYDGLVIKTIGDEVMATFTDACQAVKAALFMVKILKSTPLSDDGDTLNVKIGLHTGPVLLKDGDVFGNTVNTAARVVAQAKPRQVLTTRQTTEALGTEAPASTRLVDHINLKGIADVIDLFEVFDAEAEDVENMTFVMDEAEETDTESAFILSLNGKEYLLDGEHTTLRLGRDSANNIVVIEKAVSRFHARLDWEKGKATLSDQSINGTHILHPDGSVTHLHREKYILLGDGAIGLGRTWEAGSPYLVKFRTR